MARKALVQHEACIFQYMLVVMHAGVIRWRSTPDGQARCQQIRGPLALVFLWLAVLVATIVLRRHTAYEARKELHWWEAFYRTGSIIFGGGQVCSAPC